MNFPLTSLTPHFTLHTQSFSLFFAVFTDSDTNWLINGEREREREIWILSSLLAGLKRTTKEGHYMHTQMHVCVCVCVCEWVCKCWC